MNRNILIYLVLLLTAACDKMDITPSQTESFIKFYNTYPVISGADVKEVPGKGYAMIGTVETSDASRLICLIRTDKYGNSIDSARYFGSSGTSQSYCLQVLDDDGFAILGSHVNVSGKKEIYFIRTDSTGEVRWERTFSGSGDLEAYHVEVSTSGYFIMTGYAESDRSGHDKDVWLFGIDGNGNNIENWPTPRIIGGSSDDIGNHLQILGDGKLVITGQTRSYPLGTLNNHAFVLRTGPTGLGAILSPIESLTDDVGNCIQVIDENQFLVTGTTKNTSSGSGDDIMLKKVAYSPGGLEVQWDGTIEVSGNDFGQKLIIINNYIYLLVTRASAGTNSSIGLITTDMNGILAREIYFGENTELTCGSFERTSDNGFIIIGTNKHSDNNMSIALIKVDPEGNL